MYEELVYRSFKKMGHDVYPLKWHLYFQPRHFLKGLPSKVEAFFLKVQNHFIAGPAVQNLNRELVQLAKFWRPDLIFIYYGTHISPHSLKEIKNDHPEVILACYCNDNPFTTGHKMGHWRLLLPSVPFYDLMLAFRHQNLEDFKKAGARRVQLLRAWFAPERNHPVELSAEDQERFRSDVVFVGHYEPGDNRIAWLEEIVKSGFKLRLFGYGKYWDKPLRRSPWLHHLAPVKQVWGEDYNKALCGAKVALCILSKINLDTYTTRCFEIPATKTMMLSEYTDDLATLYAEGIEAEFFKSKEELIAKLHRYIPDEALRRSVAEAGYRRVMADGHDVMSRMRQVINWVNELR
jgi:hypothetical protein